MTAETLRCTKCSDEGHLIRVAPGRLAPLHLTRHDHQFGLVRFAPAAAVSSRDDVPQRQPEGSDTRREDVANAGPSHRPALAPRASSEGAPALTAPMPVDSLERASGARGRRAAIPPPAPSRAPLGLRGPNE